MSGLLDNFNRTDSTDPGPNWIQQINAAAPQSHDIVSNAMKAATSGFCSDYWFQSFAAAQEVWVTIVAPPTTGGFRLYGRIVPGANVNAYGVEIDAVNAYIVRVDPPVSSTTLQVIPGAITTGHRMKLRCEGNVISAWQDTGAGFVQIGSVVDNTYANGGFIGVWSQNDTGNTFDLFSGGNIYDAAVRELQVMTSRGVAW